LIHHGWASLAELRSVWTFTDLVDANDTLDRVLEAEAGARKTKPL
jgi:hypothetical protein